MSYHIVTVPLKIPAIPVANHRTITITRVSRMRNLLPKALSAHKLIIFAIRPSPIPRIKNIKLLDELMPTICIKYEAFASS